MHTASILTFDTDPEKVITPVADGLKELLHAAAKEKTVKRFVYTSSAPANSATGPQPLPDGSPAIVPTDRDTVFDSAVQMANAPPPHGPQQGGIVYLASKVEAEKLLWKFVEEEKPGFEVNVVSPYTTVGKLLGTEDRSVPSMIRAVYKGEKWPLGMMSAFMFYHVEDVALLHVAAALDPEVKGQRIQAWSGKEPFNWDDMLAIFRRSRPEHEVMDDLEDNPKVLITTDETEAKRLLLKWAGREWKNLEEGVIDALVGLK